MTLNHSKNVRITQVITLLLQIDTILLKKFQNSTTKLLGINDLKTFKQCRNHSSHILTVCIDAISPKTFKRAYLSTSKHLKNVRIIQLSTFTFRLKLISFKILKQTNLRYLSLNLDQSIHN